MSPFKFSLERVRQLREKAEKEAALNLARAQAAERDAHEAAQAAHRRSVEAMHAVSRTPGSSATVGEMHPMQLLKDALGEAQAAAAEHAVRATDLTQQEARSLGQAMQARRVLDRLREKQLDAWKVDAGREALAEMDEVARTRAALDDSNRRG
jgi:flagellar export protein FliJ